MYKEEYNVLMNKLQNIEDFYKNAIQSALRKENMISQLAQMANDVEEKTRNIEAQIIVQRRKIKEDVQEVQTSGLSKIKELDKMEEDLEECRRLHELEMKSYEEVALTKTIELEKEEEEVDAVVEEEMIMYEKEKKDMLKNEELIESLKDALIKKKAKSIEVKHKRSLKRRVMSLFCCCWKQ